jgi:hypothetical protein
MDVVEGETDYCSRTGVTYNDDRTEESSIKFEDAIDIKNEIPEAITFTPVKTEQEVMLWVCVCVLVAGHAFRPCSA